MSILYPKHEVNWRKIWFLTSWNRQNKNNLLLISKVFLTVGSLTELIQLICRKFAGSFSRTAVNVSAGCKTTMSNIVMAITVFIALELLTRLLYYTPVAILASIILSALPGLIDIKEACRIWEVDKMDFLACIGAFLGVLFGSVEIGLLIAVRSLDLNTQFNPMYHLFRTFTKKYHLIFPLSWASMWST